MDSIHIFAYRSISGTRAREPRPGAGRVNPFSLQHKVAVVTGSTKGIGLGIARVLAGQGAEVVVSSRTAADCARISAELSAETGAVVHGIACDVGDAVAIDALVAQVAERCGGIDALVCNAARMPTLVPFGAAPDAEFLAQYETNVVRTLRLCEAVVPHMRVRGGGSIVLIASRTGIRPAPQQLAYSLSKAAETHLARNLAAQYAAGNVRVNCIAPGLIRSDSSRVVFELPAALAAFERDIPLGRGGEAHEIGGAVAFLVAPAGGYVTGVTIPVDGGVAELPPSPGSSSPTFDATRR